MGYLTRMINVFYIENLMFFDESNIFRFLYYFLTKSGSQYLKISICIVILYELKWHVIIFKLKKIRDIHEFVEAKHPT